MAGCPEAISEDFGGITTESACASVALPIAFVVCECVRVECKLISAAFTAASQLTSDRGTIPLAILWHFFRRAASAKVNDLPTKTIRQRASENSTIVSSSFGRGYSHMTIPAFRAYAM